MFYKFKLAFKRLLNKESFYFIEDADLEQFIIDDKANCVACNKPVKSIEDICKIKLRKEEIIFYCKSCKLEVTK